MDISPTEFLSRYQDGSLNIIDVREELEYHSFNLGGENIPLGTLLRQTPELDYSEDAEIVVICQRGIRSETAARAMHAAGYRNVRNLTGGLLALQRLTHKTFKKSNDQSGKEKIEF